MAQNEAAIAAANAANNIHPGLWGVIGAAVLSGGRVGVAYVKAKVNPPKRDFVREALARIESTMATKEDLARVDARVEKVDGKVEAHVQFHLNHPA